MAEADRDVTCAVKHVTHVFLLKIKDVSDVFLRSKVGSFVPDVMTSLCYLSFIYQAQTGAHSCELMLAPFLKRN